MEQVASNRVVAVGLLPFDMNKSPLIIVETDLLLFSEWHFTTIPDGKNVVTRMIADTEGCLSFDLSHIVSQATLLSLENISCQWTYRSLEWRKQR